MHPEMTLDAETAKLVFNLASVAISAMMEDAVNRYKEVPQVKAAQP
jgi:hypothetical protein